MAGLAAGGRRGKGAHPGEREGADARGEPGGEARQDDDDRRVAQLRTGGPARLLELADHLAYEDTRALERVFHGLLWEPSEVAGAGGIEPPTNGFGDRYSTN